MGVEGVGRRPSSPPTRGGEQGAAPGKRSRREGVWAEETGKPSEGEKEKKRKKLVKKKETPEKKRAPGKGMG